MFVKPKEGLTILNPQTKRALPASGKEVRDSKYWQRCIARGDVLLVTQIADSAEVETEG